MRIVLQGELGSFHHLAAGHWYKNDNEYLAAESFAEVFEVLAAGQADQAVVAIENSSFGSINEVYDLLSKYGYPTIGELNERIHQQLIALPGTKLSDITEVVSHPVALAQCANFLKRRLPNAERVEYHDTAAAVEYVKNTGNPKFAAIGSSSAAETAELQILEANIENDRQNYTRFLIVSPGGKAPADANKASLVLQTSHGVGALHQALGCFANEGISLTKLQSRPLTGKIWKYQFYVDVEAAGQKLHHAIGQLQKQKCKVKVLGEYRAAVIEHEI